MTPRHFCTLFDRNYLLKGLAMLNSLYRQCPSARVFILCMDGETHVILGELNLPGVTLLRLADVEDDQLLAVKAGRGVGEYCWTLASCLTWYVFQTRPEVANLTYLDADLMFFAPLEPLFAEIGSASIAIIEHRFHPRYADSIVNGRFCVEWVGFRRDEQGLACLQRWREQCIEWCFNRLEAGRMGDQKYLDDWPERFTSVCILQHPGAGIAPWNYANYEITRGTDGIMVDGAPLVFYHFHQLQILSANRYCYMSDMYSSLRAPPVEIYAAYEDELRGALLAVWQMHPGFRSGIQPLLPHLAKRTLQNWLPKRIKRFLKSVLRT
jgi:hypothetical protein